MSRSWGNISSQRSIRQGSARLRERWVSKLTGSPLASANARACRQKGSCSRQPQLSLPVITLT